MRFKNVRWRESYKVYFGQKQQNNQIICCQAKNAEECAKILNHKCQQAGIQLPNPHIGFAKPKLSAEEKSGFKNVCFNKERKLYHGQKRQNNQNVFCTGKTAEECAKILNYKCKEAGFRIPNPHIGFAKPKLRVSAEEKSGFKNVTFRRGQKLYRGQKRHKKQGICCTAKTAEECAKILNYKCKEAGCKLPNPRIGCKKPPLKRASRKKTKTKTVSRKATRKEKLNSGISPTVKKERLDAFEPYKEMFQFQDLSQRNAYLPCFLIPPNFPSHELRNLEETYTQERTRIVEVGELRPRNGRTSTRKKKKTETLINDYPTFSERLKLENQSIRLVWLRVLDLWIRRSAGGKRKPWIMAESMEIDGIEEGFSNSKDNPVNLTRNIKVKKECEDYSNEPYEAIEII